MVSKNEQKKNWLNSDTMCFEGYGKKYKPRTKYIMSIVFMIIILVEASFLFIQAGQIFKEKSAKDVSLLAFSFLLGTSMFWNMYNMLFIGSVPVMISSTLFTIGSIIILIGIAKYGDGANTVDPSPNIA